MNGSPHTELDAQEILRRLTARGVDFVVVGGIAAVLHGSAQMTFDLDICYATDRANLEALAEMLLELRARPRDIRDAVPFAADVQTLRQVDLLTLSTELGDLDVLARPVGSPGYESLRKGAERFNLAGFSVLVASIDDLIAMKVTTARTKDLAAVEELEEIKRLRRGTAGDRA